MYLEVMFLNNKEYYVLGLLIGDSSILHKNNKNFIFFSNVNKEMSSIVEAYCQEKGYKYSTFTRTPQEENWSVLNIVEIYSEELIEYMKELELVDSNLKYHLINNPHVVRGFFETSATLFEFKDKKKIRHRIAFSGTKEILEELQNIIRPFCITTGISRRKEREHLGIISKSYRFTINRRDSKKSLLRWIYKEDYFGSELYKQKVSYYFEKALENPLNMSPEYNNYRYATKAMCKHLELSAEGIQGGQGGGQNEKPIYIKDVDDKQIATVYGWKAAYEFIARIYKEVTKIDPPIINFNKRRSK